VFIGSNYDLFQSVSLTYNMFIITTHFNHTSPSLLSSSKFVELKDVTLPKSLHISHFSQSALEMLVFHA